MEGCMSPAHGPWHLWGSWREGWAAAQSAESGVCVAMEGKGRDASCHGRLRAHVLCDSSQELVSTPPGGPVSVAPNNELTL